MPVGRKPGLGHDKGIIWGLAMGNRIPEVVSCLIEAVLLHLVIEDAAVDSKAFCGFGLVAF